ncbi:MAG: topoisomerase, partial [Abditibacteriota bacterium]|nr:topoisomerase [Abditibacteriota bacterium]
MAFLDAVQALCGPCFSPGISAPPTAKKRDCALPEANLCPNAVVSYLRVRGIDMDIVGVCLAL